MPNLKIVLVSLAFPPQLDAEVLQTVKMYKYLKSFDDIDLHVVTGAMSEDWRTLFRPAIATVGDVTRFDVFSSRYLNHALLLFAPGFASRPDLRRGAIRQAKAIAGALPWRPDMVLSRSYPISSALIGKKLADLFGVPWIMQLSDPWSISPLHPQGYDLAWNQREESAAFDRADRITFTSTRTLERYAAVYPEHVNRMRYFPNSFDPDQVRPNPWTRGQTFRIVYTGTLGATRRPDVFCDAISRFLLRVPEAKRDLEFIIAGHADRKTRAFLSSQASHVSWLGPVSFEKSMELIRSADVLALIDNEVPADQKQLCGYEFFPSKLLDYMLGQRPILGVSERSSIASEIISELGLGECFLHGELDKLSLAIEAKWRSWTAGTKDVFDISAQKDGFDARTLAGRLRDEMKEVVDAS